MTAVYAAILALLAITSGVNITAATPNRMKFTLSAVIGTVIGLFICYCRGVFFRHHPSTYLPVFAIATGAILFAGSLAGSGLVSLRRRVCRD
jgi:hydrogenase/urease accessory protein HupE